ncbi:hypothetical protein [Photobacterium leiognathi]|uniref:hypothetical protein n=1 Tax=Photobacterium leiognathi TaxID=553611 RepID=UPI002982A143|nr:hypothetical protein [Photobacterium leiognathi]
MTPVETLTHDQIADFAATQLKRFGYQLAFSNLTSNSHIELPDVLGFTGFGKSIVIEVKTSISDFHADKKKKSRVNKELSIGNQRVYLTPKGLLNPQDIPYGWLLWEIHGKNKPRIVVIKGRDKKRVVDKNLGPGHYKTEIKNLNISKEEYFHFDTVEKNIHAELMWCIKFLHRANQRGYDVNQLANNKE